MGRKALQNPGQILPAKSRPELIVQQGNLGVGLAFLYDGQIR